MMYSDKEYTKKQQIAGFLMAVIPLLFGVYMLIFGFKQIADKKAENPSNLIDGCMYYHGTSKLKSGDKYYHLRVDGIRTNTLRGFTGKIYENVRQKGFVHFDDFKDYISSHGSKKCYPVRYVKLDYILFQKVFIYEYTGDLPSNYP